MSLQIIMPFSVSVPKELGAFDQEKGYWILAVWVDDLIIPRVLVADEERNLHWVKLADCKVAAVVAPQLGGQDHERLAEGT